MQLTHAGLTPVHICWHCWSVKLMLQALHLLTKVTQSLSTLPWQAPICPPAPVLSHCCMLVQLVSLKQPRSHIESVWSLQYWPAMHCLAEPPKLPHGVTPLPPAVLASGDGLGVLLLLHAAKTRPRVIEIARYIGNEPFEDELTISVVVVAQPRLTP